MTEWIITSSLLIIIVIALRTLLKGKVKPILQYALWGIVLLRLLVPLSFFESSLSIMNALGSSRSVEIAQSEEKLSGYDDFALDAELPLSPEDGQAPASSPEESDLNLPMTAPDIADIGEFPQTEKAVKARDILIPLYIAGVIAVLGIFVWSNLRFSAQLRRKGRRRLDAPDTPLPVYISTNVETPCLFGVFRPEIYVTPDCAADERALRHVLAHESTHYRHGDNIWGALRCLVLALHWYNPLVWWAAILSKRDGELACDEGALRRLGDAERLDYGRTLIALTCTRGNFKALALNATTMTGSKKSIRERISFIAKKPKMALYALAALIFAAAVAVCCTFSGANSFSDREARREANPLAESVAMVNSCEIDGRPEIIRYEGGSAKADPDVNMQYVRLTYPLKNSLQKIIVEFCMTDGKGQHYDEPFSTESWYSRCNTPIVSASADDIESVHIWRRGYANPLIPEAYREEIKKYVSGYYYANEHPTGAVIDSSLNDAGFTVFLKDGSSISFGVDYAYLNGHYYRVTKPSSEDMPDWLTELLTAPGKMEMEYHELIKVDDSIKAKVEPDIISHAVDMLAQQIDYFTSTLGINIIDARLSALENITTGAADQSGNAVEMYRMEYRLLPENADDIVMTENREMEDGWLTEWSSDGQPYLMYWLEDFSSSVTPAGRITTKELDTTYSTETMLERYGNKYTAAAMEKYHEIVGRYDHEYRVMLQGEDYAVAPYYHLKNARKYDSISGGWLYADGKLLELDPHMQIPTVSISDDIEAVPEDQTELSIIYDRFVIHDGLCIRDENFEIPDLSPQEFFTADDLYALPVGSYYVTFDIRVRGEYISELGQHEQTTYTCIFRLEVVEDAFSDTDGQTKIEIPLSDDTAMCFYAWPVVLDGIFVWLPKEDITRVADVISKSSFTEISENHEAFNPQLTELYTTGDMASGDQLDRYVFIHPYDYREELNEKLNKASHEELDALTKPQCILVHDYNIEKQQYFAYAIIDGKYYMADTESELRIMNFFDNLVDKYTFN